eukprot:c21653_g2_i5 orf=1321-3468(+)
MYLDGQNPAHFLLHAPLYLFLLAFFLPLPHHHHHHLQYVYPDRGLPVSARKLAASLWELQELPLSKARPTRKPQNVQQESGHVSKNDSSTEHQWMRHGQYLSPASSRISKGSHKRSPISIKVGDGGKALVRLEKDKGQLVMPVTNVPKKEITAGSGATSPSKSLVLGSKGILSNLGCEPTSTSDLLKVLNHVWIVEEQHSSSMSLVGALRTELDKARSELQELLSNEKSHHENINKRVAEVRALWQEQEEQSVRIAVQSVRQELENEQRSKQKLELLHKKVVREFRDARKSLIRALEDFEREKKARQLMEEVCDELAREIGQDKARVEELQRESVKVREEVEEERKMLQMAEVWREERVQMKLMEAKLELEEKNTALDKLRSQLEAFLKMKRAGDSKDGGDNVTGDARLDLGRHSMDVVIGQNLADSFHSREQRFIESGRYSVDSGCDRLVEQCAWVSGSDDDDDLHSIELNHKPLIRVASSKWGQPSFHQHVINFQERRFSDEKLFSGSQSKQLLAGKSRGIDRPRDKQMDPKGGEEVKVEDAQGGFSQGFQWIECSVEGGEIREWRQEQQGDLQEGRGGSTKSGQSDFEDSQSHISFGPRVLAKNVQGHSESLRRGAQGSSNLFHEWGTRSGEWQHQISNSGYRQQSLMVGSANYGSNMVSSPTRKWNHHLSSPDIRSKASSEASRGAQSLKAKLLEAKLESQQAQQKGGKNA